MRFADEEGSGVTEQLMVMTLMILFGLYIYLMVFSGYRLTQKIENDKDAQIEARTAISYINVRLRQFDAVNGIVIVSNSYNGGDSILLRNRNPGAPELDYDTWIFWDRGTLMEVLTDADARPEWEAAVYIAQIEGFKAVQNGDFVVSSVLYTYAGEQHTLSSSVLIRSGQEGAYAA